MHRMPISRVTGFVHARLSAKVGKCSQVLPVPCMLALCLLQASSLVGGRVQTQ